MSHLVGYAEGANGQIQLFEDSIQIQRKGIRSSLSPRAKQTDIPLAQIGSVEFKPAGTLANGYIQFVYLGQAPKTGLIEVSNDENSVLFRHKQQPAFERVRSAVQERITMLKQNQVPQTSTSQEHQPLSVEAKPSKDVLSGHGSCSKCGKALLEDANFCLACGAPTNPKNVEKTLTSGGKGMSVYKVSGDQEELEVFEDKLTITSIGWGKGRKATKTIPFASITGILYQKPGLTSGYLRFTFPGGSIKGLTSFSDSPLDENTFHFDSKDSALVEEVKAFIDRKMQDARAPGPSVQISTADELLKLAKLKEQGLLSEEEFARAKARLLGL